MKPTVEIKVKNRKQLIICWLNVKFNYLCPISLQPR